MKLNERSIRIIRAAARGASRGGPAGALCTIVSSVAVVATFPAWVPFVGAGIVVSPAVIAIGAGIGASVGAVTTSVVESFKIKKESDAFNKEFPGIKEISSNKRVQGTRRKRRVP